MDPDSRSRSQGHGSCCSILSILLIAALLSDAWGRAVPASRQGLTEGFLCWLSSALPRGAARTDPPVPLPAATCFTRAINERAVRGEGPLPARNEINPPLKGSPHFIDVGTWIREPAAPESGDRGSPLRGDAPRITVLPSTQGWQQFDLLQGCIHHFAATWCAGLWGGLRGKWGPAAPQAGWGLGNPQSPGISI